VALSDARSIAPVLPVRLQSELARFRDHVEDPFGLSGADIVAAHGPSALKPRVIRSLSRLLEGELGMSEIRLEVNRQTRTVDVDPSTPLLYVLRNDLDLRGPRFGCGLGQCGACTVLINGAAVRSCVTPVASVTGAITTLEGLAQNGRLDPVQQAWIEVQAPQCGFCQNGQILTAKALLDRNPTPTGAQIREAMAGVLCRCMTYYRIQAGIRRAVQLRAAVAPGNPEVAA
jgi:aerobic-type carbon monoxide dehydrogenase small subunit (CoxS/CutS family)